MAWIMAGNIVEVALPRMEGNLSQNENLTRARDTFLGVAKEPHGRDRKLGAFYQAVYDLSGSNLHFAQFFSDSINTAVHRGISPSLFTNLYYRAAQYVDIFGRGRKEYGDEFTDSKTWEGLLVGENGLVTNEGDVTVHGAVLQDILKTKETTTTIYQRYAGSNAVLNMLYPQESGQGLRLADFGCGGNYWLRGSKENIPFKDIKVAEGTPPHLADQIMHFISQPLTIDEGLGVDKNPVNDEEEFMWRLACSFYPGELTAKSQQSLIELEKRMSTISGINFLQGDLLELEHNHRDGTLPTDRFHAVTLSTILYQSANDPEAQISIIESARESLQDDGVIILQDFVQRDADDPTKLHFFDPSEWGKPFSYRTLIMRKNSDQWEEILQWRNGRCREVRPGMDFDTILPPSPAYGPKPSIAIFPSQQAA